jgi:hypothetical protein
MCDDAAIAALFDALCMNQTVRKLSLNDMVQLVAAGDKASTSLGRLLRANVTLQILSLVGIEPLLHEAGIVALAEALGENCSLRILNIEASSLSTLVSATALGNALQVNSSLEELYLFGSSLGDDGACALAEGLRLNSMLKKLDIRNNEIEGRGATALASSLRSNACLQDIELRANRVGDNGAAAFAGMLAVNTSLQTLDLSSNRVGVAGTVALAHALRSNTTLRHLTLRCNDVTHAGMNAMMDAMRHNITLLSISVPLGEGTIRFPENRLTTPEELLRGFLTPPPEIDLARVEAGEVAPPAPAPARSCLLI